MKQSVEIQIVKSISNHKRGKIFFPSDFLELGSITAIRKALSRLEKKEFLVRLSKGIYLYPKNSKSLGTLYPSLEEIAKAIAKRDKARLIPTGSLALNRLGFSTQIPMNVVFYTDGSPRRITINGGTIKFKLASPKLLSAKNNTVILVIQALRELGQENIEESTINRIKEILLSISQKEINHDLKFAPIWIRELIKKQILA